MSKSKKSGRRQAAVLEDLFTGELEEPEVLAKHNISQGTYERWLADPHFAELFEQRIGRAHRQSRLILARYAPLAAAKLVELAHSDKVETARKACLDIIALHGAADAGEPPAGRSAPEQLVVAGELTPELARRLLAALAGETRANDGLSR
jgi:hypothetical protein